MIRILLNFLYLLAQVSDVAKGPLVMTSGVYNIQNKIILLLTYELKVLYSPSYINDTCTYIRYA